MLTVIPRLTALRHSLRVPNASRLLGRCFPCALEAAIQTGQESKPAPLCAPVRRWARKGVFAHRQARKKTCKSRPCLLADFQSHYLPGRSFRIRPIANDPDLDAPVGNLSTIPLVANRAAFHSPSA